MNMAEHEIVDHLVVLLAGRAAETLIYDELTVGAENDLERATTMARRMVTHWGMSKKLGPVSYKMSDEDPFLGGQMHKGRQFSEHTMEVIDEEVHEILEAASKSALELLKHHREALTSVAESLVENEELDRHEIADLIGPSVHKEKEADLPERPPVVSDPPEAETPNDPPGVTPDNAEAAS